MNTKTLKALNDSIAHWERMRDNPNGEDRPGRRQCALCGLFNRNFADGCAGCPVKAKTGEVGCAGTPYEHANAIFGFGANRSWRKAAQAEINFLKSLLPKTKGK
jgi:hypothetical protein